MGSIIISDGEHTWRECLDAAGPDHLIKAIAMFRQRTGLGLKESKEAVQAVAALARLEGN